MARLPRLYLPDCPYHITQRGNDHRDVYRTDADRRIYCKLLAETAAQEQVRLLAYCLMTNHVHFVAIPARPDSFPDWLRRLQGRYAQCFNLVHHRSGHLWQGRYFACALDDAHLWHTLRYVERNPVRAHMVKHAADYEWSSATAHLSTTGQDDSTGALDLAFWRAHDGATRWRQLLEEEHDDTDDFRHRLRRHTYAGRPFGPPEFVRTIETRLGHTLPRLNRIAIRQQFELATAAISPSIQ